MQIEDGKGTGYKIEVDTENKGATTAVTASEAQHTNHVHSEAYSVTMSGVSPTAADDCIFYMVNSDDTDMVVEGILLGAKNFTADDTVYLKIGATGTRNSATALTPVNLKGGSSLTATGTFEEGVDLDGGAATLSGGSEFQRWVSAGVTDLFSTYYAFPQHVILPKNQTLTMWVGGSATATVYATIYFYYHS